MTHKFKIGQRVCRVQLGLPGDKGGGEIFEVLRLMPEDQTGERSYRIRTEAGERAIRESELVAVSRL
ncbi:MULTISPECIES: hypothetical protein [unclassified Methylobacterium]|uniref:hypothetical protein n=1 Tax=unclassified Methylobacterium TaxID=2615210 RepID=UPI001FBAA70C|nr:MULTISPECIES: hypothetical protein [unclassified Methylobacterium]MCJ2092349.1 hypothetical protein [Methylobacterium sp. J-072]MCJ2144606.1 hypothetical protein [Methylobacterium sp. E-066]